MTDAMDIDHPAAAAAATATATMDANAAAAAAGTDATADADPTVADVVDEIDEENVTELLDRLDDVAAMPVGLAQVPLLLQIIQNDHYTGPKATQLKERAVYDLTRAYCAAEQYHRVVAFLTGTESDSDNDNRVGELATAVPESMASSTTTTGQAFLSQINKAKTAKVVRQVLDIVCTAAPDAREMQARIARSIIAWTEREKRSFLRQRVEAKLASILFGQHKYSEALEIVDRLLYELKKLDDKQLLVETHLLESKIHFALRNVPKAKAALTASRTAANAIYVSPSLQADIDSMSGTIHTEEGDYNTAHSYFFEAFEQLDQMNSSTEAMTALKYMMLCRILHSLRAALKLSSTGTVGMKVSSKADVDLSGMISGRQGVKYAGTDIEAMTAIGEAASHRNLKEFEAVLHKYQAELSQDLLIKHHLHILHEQLLESNLIRIIEPYSCVELDHIAALIDMPATSVERKLSQMILDGKFQGILDQGKGQLVVYEESAKDDAMEKGLQVIANIDTVVTSLFERSKALRTVMM